MPTILLVRHAQASFGSADYDVLSPLGVEQAELVATAIARRELNVTRLLSGSARRQRETAAPFLADGGPLLEIDPRWNEFDTEQVIVHHGAAPAALDGSGPEGRELTSREFQGVLDVALEDWMRAGEDSEADQSWPAFLAAGAAALKQLASGLGSGETGIAFTSAGVISAICARLLGSHLDLFPALNRILVNTSVTKLAVGGRGTSLLTLNEHAHIDDGGGALLTYR